MKHEPFSLLICSIIIYGAAVDFVDFQIAVLMNQFEYKKQKLEIRNNNMSFNISLLLFKITSLSWTF